MIRGMQSAAQAMIATTDRQEVLAHNLVNLRVPGYKQDATSVSGFVAALSRAQQANPGPWQMASLTTPDIGGLGLGAQTDRVFVDMNPGGLEETGRSLDIGLDGDGFLTVRTPEGDLYSRGGALNLDGMGRLTTSEGYMVLGADGKEITLPDDSVTVSSDGAISAGGKEQARLAVTEFAPGTMMVKAGELLFAPVDTGIAASPATSTTVHSGYLERSNVDDVAVMTGIVSLVREYQANQRMLAAQDELLGKAVNELGKV